MVNSIKVEPLNPAVSQALPGKETGNRSGLPDASQVSRLTSDVDSINISIPGLQPDKTLSTLISRLIDVLSISNEIPLNPPFTKGDPNISPLLAKGGEGGFSTLLGSLFYKGEEPLSFLKDFIEKSGLLYEAKIARGDIKAIDEDLKGLLLRLVEKMGEKSEGGKAVSVLLNEIEARQLLNLKAKNEGAVYLQIPVLLPQGASTAEVYVRRDSKERGGYKGDSYRVAFTMELRESGLLSVDAHVSGNNVSIRLKAEKAEFLEYMKSHLPELSDSFAGYGMRTVVTG